MRPRKKIKSPKLMVYADPSVSVSRTCVKDLCAKPSQLESLVMVVAPAGYGKSTVLSQMNAQLSNKNLATCWLSLDEEDDAPPRVVRFLVESIAGVIEGFGIELKVAMEAETSFSVTAIAHTFLQELSEAGTFITVFIDDFHFINNKKINLLIKVLIEYCGDFLRLVIASRVEPAISLGQLRAKGLVKELGADALSFSPQEVREMILQNGFNGVEDGTIEAISNRSEGWAAGIQLLCLAAKNAPEQEKLFQDFTGRDRNIADYLGDTVLDHLPENTHKFLLFTSVLERLNADLCEAILPEFPGQQFLEKIEASGLFLLPLDRERKWFRYHHLFADFLQTRLERDYTGVAKKLRASVARWFHAAGDQETAIKYSLAAEDYDFAAERIAEYALELAQMRGVHSTFLRWINQLPETYRDRWPEIRLGQAWSLTFTNKHAEAEQELHRLEKPFNRGAVADQMPSAGSIISDGEVKQSCGMIRCVIDGLSDKYDACAERCEKWFKAWPDASDFNKGTVGNSFGYACNGRQDFDNGIAVIADARAAFTRCKSPYGVGWATAIEGMLLTSRGAFSRAKDVLETGLEAAVNSVGAYSQSASILSLLLSEVLYEQGDLTGARLHVKQGWPALKEVASMEFVLAGYTVSAKLMNVSGDDIAALSLLEEGRDLGLVHQMPRLRRSLELEGFTMMLRAGQLEQAERYAENTGLNTLSGEGYEHQIVTRTQVRLLLAKGAYKETLESINPLLETWRKCGRDRLLMTGLALKSAALWHLGMENEAMRYIEQALVIGAKESAVRRLLDDTLFIAPVIEHFLDKRRLMASPIGGIPQAYIKRLCTAFDIGNDAKSKTTDETPIEALSKKEKKILLLVEEGLTNKAIADALFVSEKTVKWHLHNVFGKLDVRNRTSAVASARRMVLF